MAWLYYSFNGTTSPRGKSSYSTNSHEEGMRQLQYTLDVCLWQGASAHGLTWNASEDKHGHFRQGSFFVLFGVCKSEVLSRTNRDHITPVLTSLRYICPSGSEIISRASFWIYLSSRNNKLDSLRILATRLNRWGFRGTKLNVSSRRHDFSDFLIPRKVQRPKSPHSFGAERCAEWRGGDIRDCKLSCTVLWTDTDLKIYDLESSEDEWDTVTEKSPSYYFPTRICCGDNC